MREIVLDTETTGLAPGEGDRLVEIGCVELVNHLPSGVTFQRYVNPQRDMPQEAFAIHGLSEEFLRGHPIFGDVADDFLAFIGEAPLIIHNAAFDLGFLNAELERAGRPVLAVERAIDTLAMARRKFPGSRVSLNDLCRRFAIDLSVREKHGALLDSELLAEVYLELVGGRQPGLTLSVEKKAAAANLAAAVERPPRSHAPSPAELEAHAKFVAAIPGSLWKN